MQFLGEGISHPHIPMKPLPCLHDQRLNKCKHFEYYMYSNRYDLASY